MTLRRNALGTALGLLVTLPSALAACSPDDGGPGGSKIVVGLQADQGVGIQRVEVEATVDGVKVDTQSFAVQTGVFPKEMPVTGAPGGQLEVRVRGFGADPATPIVTRVGRARIQADTKLMRLKLDARCVGGPPVFGGAPPPATATCADGLTCVAGGCASPDVVLEGYAPGWPDAEPDICRPANAGAPEVILGTGQTDWAPLADGQVVELEQGPQGGNHIWVSARMKNLKRSGSRTLITGGLASGGEPIPPSAFVFTYDRDEGAYCKIFGLRFQVDAGASDLRDAYKRFLGQELDVTVEVIDATGASAKSTKRLRIAERRLCADGTYTTCN